MAQTSISLMTRLVLAVAAISMYLENSDEAERLPLLKDNYGG
jgi:hypothetical protein